MMNHWESTYGLGCENDKCFFSRFRCKVAENDRLSRQARDKHEIINAQNPEKRFCSHNYILNLPPSKDGIITPKMAAAAAAFGVERHRRYGTGSSDPETPSKCELARAAGRLGQWTGEVTRAAAAETGVEAVRPNQNETQLVLALGARTLILFCSCSK
jgi:hypothetical protein